MYWFGAQELEAIYLKVVAEALEVVETSKVKYKKEDSRRTELRKMLPASEWREERMLAEKAEEAAMHRKMAGGKPSFKDMTIQC